MPLTVLFVDDDRRLIEVYAEAVREAGFLTHCVYSVDDALAYLRSGRAADVIVWDMMIAPGQAYAQMDTRGDLVTGKFLYRDMRQMRADASFILLANQDPDFEDGYRGKAHSHMRLKTDTSPDDLAEFIAKICEK